MINLCAMFDSAYLSKGLALCASLQRHLPSFHLFVLALDDAVRDYLRAPQPGVGAGNPRPDVTVIALDEFEDEALKAVRPGRTWQEYIWTLTPSLPLYCLARQELDDIAYLDADCFLFGDLAPLYDEVRSADVAIIPHRFTPRHAERLRQAGTFNVSWVYFRNSQRGLETLLEWREQCLAWCYYRHEGDKFADQGYLNDWPQQHGAHVVSHLGANLAPWNQEQFSYHLNGGHMHVSDGRRDDQLLFYHFHELELRGRKVTRRTSYSLAPAVARYVYPPYEAELAAVA